MGWDVGRLGCQVGRADSRVLEGYGCCILERREDAILNALGFLQSETQAIKRKLMNLPIDLPLERVADFCQRWRLRELALFGSVLRTDFHPDSDLDVLVQFHPEAHPTFSSLEQMEAELKSIFHRDVDLVTRQGIESSRNYLRRNQILASAQVIYAEGP